MLSPANNLPSKLQFLLISNCPKLLWLSGLQELSSLKDLKLYGCPLLMLPPLEELPFMLQVQFVIINCPNIEEWCRIYNLSNIYQLLVNLMELLTEQKLMGIYSLQQSSQQAKDALSQDSAQTDNLQQQIRQSARALLSISDYFSRLQALSSLWLARPCKMRCDYFQFLMDSGF